MDFNTSSSECTLIENIISLIYSESCNGIYWKIFDFLLSRSDVIIPKSFTQYDKHSIYCYYRGERQLFRDYKCLNCNVKIAERKQTIIQKLEQKLHSHNRIEGTDMFKPGLKIDSSCIQLFTSYRCNYDGDPIDYCDCDCDNMIILTRNQIAEQVWLIFKRLGLPHVDPVIFEISSYFLIRRKPSFRQFLR